MNYWILINFFSALGGTTRVVFLHASQYRMDVVCITCSIRYLHAIWDF